MAGVVRWKIRWLLLLIFNLLVAVQLNAQNHTSTITGKVMDELGEPISFASVALKNTHVGGVSNEKGNFTLVTEIVGKHTLLISYLGYETKSTDIELKPGDTRHLSVYLEESTTEIDEAVIYDKSKSTLLREESYAIEVIETKEFKNLSTNANDILGRISGVSIRQSGGLGSEFSISLNGLSNNQVRIFIDGVPMDYFGSSLSLNNFSANLIERIEAYKGVVPIHLSADALGGAINVVTSGKTKPYLDASYSLGSFNTHLASLNTQYREKKSGFTVRLKSFFNSSDNNYKVPIKMVNFETGKESETPVYVERFHDAYQSRMAWVETGFTSVNFADHLFAGIMYSDNYKELQQPVNAVGQAKIPYGEVHTEEDKIIANLTYAKKGLLGDRLGINAYAVGVFANEYFKDTSSYRYDWFGNKEFFHANVGEIENRKTLLNLGKENFLGNVNAEYRLFQQHNIAVNFSLNHLNLQGSDALKEQNNTQFGYPNIVTKHVAAAAYTNSHNDGRLKNTVFTKIYNYRINSLETNYLGDEFNPFTQSKEYVGFGISTTYQFHIIQLKASFENATRFPEVIELFGDGLNYVANPTLLPEQSNNYNLGFIANHRSGHHLTTLSVNTFRREAENFIRPQVTGLKTSHINEKSVVSMGIDLSGSYKHSNIILSVNGTYLDLRNNTKWKDKSSNLKDPTYNIRLPNVPYLFGNMTVSYRFPDLFITDDNFSTTIGQNYVHEFYYRWENLASNGKGVVPMQLTTNLEFVYSMDNEKYNVAFGVLNLWDAEVYDNFQQRRPGRTFNFKLRYFIH